MRSEQPHPNREELFAYRDGELKADRRVVIEAHVAVCHACRETIDEVSRLESDLKGRAQEPGDSYFSRMTESVMGRIAAVAPPLQHERRRSDAEAEWEKKRTRAPRLPWVAVFSTVSAAVTVVVIGVLLFRQGALMKSAPPVAILENSAPDAARQRAVAESSAGGRAESDASGKKRADEVGRSKDSSTRENAAAGSGEDLAKNEETKDKVAEQEANKPTLQDGDQKLQVRSEAPAGAVVGQKMTSEDLRSLPADQMSAARKAAESPRTAGAAAEGAGQYQALLRRYDLPPLWGPGISDELVLRAEPALRNLYRTGGVTTAADSARARLYFAEAARLKAGSFPDSTAIDEIVHHYQRAIGLSGGDSETGRIASARLQEFLREQSSETP